MTDDSQGRPRYVVRRRRWPIRYKLLERPWELRNLRDRPIGYYRTREEAIEASPEPPEIEAEDARNR